MTTAVLLLILAILIVCSLVIWAIDSLPNIPGTVKGLLKVAAIIVTAIAVAQKAGLMYYV
jgi:hypothetical protein